MSNFEVNKKKIIGIVATSAVVLGSAGIGLYSFLNTKEAETVESSMVTAAKKYVENNNIAIDDKIIARVNTIKEYINTDTKYGELSYVEITNNNGEYNYEPTVINASKEVFQGVASRGIEEPILTWETILSTENKTNKSVLVTINFSEKITILDTVLEDGESWIEDEDAQGNTVLTKTFEINGTDRITVKSKLSPYPEVAEITITNIDRTPIDVTIDNTLLKTEKVEGSEFPTFNYETLKAFAKNVTVSFGKSNGTKINEAKITNNTTNEEFDITGQTTYTTTKDGEYTLYLKDEAGNEANVNFQVFTSSPSLKGDGVIPGHIYNEDVEIRFDYPTTVTVINKTTGKEETITSTPGVESNKTLTEDGEYEIIITNPTGATEKIEFEIDKTAPKVLEFKPKNDNLTNQDVTMILKTNEPVTILSTTPAGLQYSEGKKVEETNEAGEVINTYYEYEITVTENGPVSVTFEDKAHNQVTTDVYDMNLIDKEGPKVTLVSRNELPTNKAITVVLQANKEIEILESTETFTSVSGSTKKYSAKVSENGTIKVSYKDAYGNTGEVELIIDNIDKDKPEIGGITPGFSYDKNTTSLIPTYTDKNDIDTVSLTRKFVNADGKKEEETVADYTFTKDTDQVIEGKVTFTGSEITLEGIYTLTVTDKAGNKTTIKFNIDRTEPIVSGVADGTFYKKNVTPQFRDALLSVSTSVLEYTDLSGNKTITEDFKTKTTLTEEGSYTLTVTDTAGNSNIINFVIDKHVAEPTITPSIIVDGLETEIDKNTPTSSDVILTIVFDEDVTITNKDTSNIVPVDGSKRIYKTIMTKNGTMIYKYKDAAGNTGQVSYDVTNIDKKAPVISNIKNGDAFNVESIIPEITDDNDFTVTIDGNPYTAGTPLTEEKVYELTATDIVGNTTTIEFAIDRTAPVVSPVVDGGSYKSDFRITWEDLTETTATLKYTDLDGNEETNNFKNNDAVRKEGTYVLTVTDKAGNKTIINFTMDKTAPTGIISASRPNDQILNEDVVLTLETSEEVEITNVNPDGISPLKGTKFTITISKNKNMIFKFKDAAGNTGQASYEVTNIDKTAPVLVVTDYLGVEHKKNFNQTIELGTEGSVLPTFTVSDTQDENPVVDVTIKDTKGNVITDSEGNQIKDINALTKGTYVITYTAKDNATNITEIVAKLTVKDTTAPTINYVVTNEANKNEAGWFKEALNVEVTLSDLSGIKSYSYRVLKGEEVLKDWTEVEITETDTTVVKNFTVDNNGENITFEIKATDKSNNETEVVKSNSYKIDTEIPTITQTITDPLENGWNNTAVIITPSVTETISGINTVILKYTYKNKAGETISETLDLVDGKFTLNVESSEINYTIEATDIAGNKGTLSNEKVIKIDKTAPVINGSSLDKDENGNYVKYLELGTPETLNYVLPELTATDTVDANVTVTKEVKPTLDVTKLGEYIATYTATDEAGNSSTLTLKVIVRDTTAPTGSLSASPEDLTQGPVELILTTSEKVVFTEEETNRLKELGITISEETAIENGKYTYKVTVSKDVNDTLTFEDLSGNVVETPVEIIVNCIDKTAPTLTVGGKTEDFSIKVELGTEGNVLPEYTVTDNKDTNPTVTIKDTEGNDVTEIKALREGTHTVIYKAEDKAGNSTEITVTIIIEDKTAPTISYEVTNEGNKNDLGWFKEALNVEVTLSDLSGIKSYSYRVLKGEEVLKDWTEIEVTETESEVIKNFTVDNNGEGITFEIKATDKSNNETKEIVKSNSYKIDTVAPKLSGSISNEKHGDWYWEAATVVVSKEEATSGLRNLTYELSTDGGVTYSSPVNIDLETLTFTIDTEGKTIKYRLTATDNAGNVTTETDEIFVSENIKIDLNSPTADFMEDLDSLTPTKEDIILNLVPSEKINISSEEIDRLKELGITITPSTVEGQENNYIVTITKDVNTTINFTDESGKTGSTELVIENLIDKEELTADVEADIPNTTLTNDKVILTFTLNKDVELKDIIVTPNTLNITSVGGSKKVYEIVVTENTNVSVNFTDHVGHTVTSTYNVTNIDKNKPEIIESSITMVPAGRTKQNVIITFKTTKEVEFTGNIIPTPVEGEDNTYTFTATERQDYVLNFKDKVGSGNAGDPYTISVKNIDRVAPTITINDTNITITEDENGNKVYTKYIEVGTTENVPTATAEDLNVLTDLMEEVTVNSTIKDAEGSIVTSIDTTKAGTYTVTYEAIDFIDGNKAELVLNIIVRDTTAPTGSLSASPEDLTQGPVELILTTSEKVVFTEEETNRLKELGITISEETAIEGGKYTYKVTVSKDVNDTLTFEDLSGNVVETPVEIIVNCIDNDAPVLTIKGPNITENEDGTYNEYVELGTPNYILPEYEVEDRDTNVTVTKVIKDSEGNIVTNIDTNVVGVYTVTYTATDTAGNSTSKTLTVTVRDTSAPSINYTVTNKPSSTGWYTKPLNVEVTLSDLSGIKSYSYRVLKGEEVLKDWTEVEITETDTTVVKNFTVDNNGENITFEIKATDKSNTTTPEDAIVKSEQYNIDTVKPSIEHSIITKPSENDWYKSDVEINVNASDVTSGLKSLTYTYTTDDGKTWSEEAPVVDGKFTIKAEGKQIRYVIIAEDNAGLIKTENSGDIKIDKTAPVINGSSLDKDENGNYVKYLELGTPETLNYVLPELTATDTVDANVTVTKEVKPTLDVTKLGEYIATYTATDEAGNSSTLTLKVIVRDTTAPTGSLSASPEGLTQGPVELILTTSEKIVFTEEETNRLKELGVTISEETAIEGGKYTYKVTVSKDVNDTLTFEDLSGNVVETPVEIIVNCIDKTAPTLTVGGKTEDFSIKVELGTEGNVLPEYTVTDNKDTNPTVTIKDTEGNDVTEINALMEGTHTVIYKAEDQAGNSTEITVTIIIEDKTAPTISYEVTNEANKNEAGWFKEALNVEVTLSDLSGIKSYSYRVLKGEEVLKDWTEIEVTETEVEVVKNFTVDNNGENITFEIKATDKSNNETTEIVKSNSYKIDTELPTPKGDIQTAINEKTGWYNENIIVKASYTETISGVSEILYAVKYGDAAWSKWAAVNEDGTFEINQSSSNISYMIRVIDKAGNARNLTVNNIKLDKDAPVITVLENTTDFEQTIELGDKFEIPAGTVTEDIDTNINNTTINPKVSETFTDSNNVTIKTGTFTLTYEISDMAGNNTTLTATIKVVDTTAPTITVTDLNGVDHTSDFTIVIERLSSFVIPTGIVTDNDPNTVKSVTGVGTVDTNTAATYTVTYTVTDAAGLETKLTLTVIVEDTTNPEITNITPNPKDPNNPLDRRKGEIRFEFTVSEEIKFTENATAYRPVEGKENTYSFTVTEDGIYNINFEDMSGNKGSYSFELVDVIDNEGPVMDNIKDGDKFDTNITPTPEDLTDVDHYELIKNGKEVEDFVLGTTTITEDGNYVLKIYDDLGNETIINFTKDEFGPTINVYDKNDETKTYADGSTIRVEINTPAWTVDNLVESLFGYNGVDEVDSYNPNLTDEEKVINIITNSNVQINKLSENDKEYSITFTATDKSNHTTTHTIYVVVEDTNNPTVEASVENEGNTWYQDYIQFNYSGSDYDKTGTILGSGIDHYEYQIVINYEGDTPVWPTEWTTRKETVYNNYTAGKIAFRVRAVDKAGNKSEIKEFTNLYLDVEAPSAPVVKINGQDPINDGTWYKNVLDFTASSTDDGSGLKAICYKYNLNDEAGWTNEECVETTNQINFQITTESSNIEYEIYAKDNAGKTSEVVKLSGIKFDKTAPTITIDNTDGNITEDKENKDTFIVNVPASKEGTYNVPNASASDFVDKTVTTATKDITSLPLNGVGTHTVTYKAIDEAGNEKIVYLKVIIKDTTAPVVKLDEETKLVRYDDKNFNLYEGVTATDNFDESEDLTITLANNSDKVDLYTPGTYEVYFIATDKSGNVSEPVKRIIVVKATTTGNIIVDDNEHCTKGEDCYNKEVTNNYVWYSGHLWRAYKVNADGTIKLVTEDSPAGFAYDDVSSSFATSHAKEWLEKEFFSALNNKNNLIVETKYCNEQTNSITPRLTCNPSSEVLSKVGLLTLDEWTLVGGKDSYLTNGDRFYTMTPTGSRNIVIVTEDGALKVNLTVTEPYAMRPVITVKASEITKGNGTIDNPYHITNDESAKANESLNERFSGEYVTFAGQTWRIVETNGNSGTKLIYDGYYMIGNEVALVNYGNFGTFNTTSGIGEYLNNTVYNSLFNASEKNAIRTSDWIYNTAKVGDNPLNTTLKPGKNTTTANVGLSRIGELMSGSSVTARTIKVNGQEISPKEHKLTSWTLNGRLTEQGTFQWHTTWAGTMDPGLKDDAELYTKRAIRPVINLKSTVKIKSGNGEYNNPYVLSY